MSENKIDVPSHLSGILNMSRALEMALAGCSIPTLDYDALNALAENLTERLQNLQTMVEAEAGE